MDPTTTKTDEAAAQPQAVDLPTVKAKLGLPADAPELDTVTALLEVIAVMQSKYDALLADNAGLEKDVANRDLAAYAEVIQPEDREYWAAQLLANRAATVKILDGFKARIVPPAEPAEGAKPAAKPATERIPLVNRVVPGTKPVSEVIPEPTTDTADRAAKIRNRAAEIRAGTGLPYVIAFERAEREFPAK